MLAAFHIVSNEKPMVWENDMCSASHPAVLSAYLCIIEEMLTVSPTPTWIKKLWSTYMKKVSIFSLMDECVFMVEGVTLNVVTKLACSWVVLCPSIYSLPLPPLKEGLYNPVNNSSQWTGGEVVFRNLVRFRLQTCITRKFSLSPWHASLGTGLHIVILLERWDVAFRKRILVCNKQVILVMVFNNYCVQTSDSHFW